MGKQKLQGKENTCNLSHTESNNTKGKKNIKETNKNMDQMRRQRSQEESRSGCCCAGIVSMSHGA